MKICYVTIDSLIEGVGRSQIVPHLELLAELGQEVVVVSLEKREDDDMLQRLQANNISWISLDFGNQGILEGVFRFFRLAKSLPNADVYHARSDVPALAMILKRRKPFLWDVRSLWVEQKSDSQPKKKILKILKYFWIFIERLISSQASALNVLAHSLVPILEKRCKRLPQIKTVIPTTVNLEKFEFSPKIMNRRRILLSGTFNNFYDISRIKEFLKIGRAHV